MACPFFFPTQRTFSIAWSFPHRLPLGAGFCGTCRAGKEEFTPDEATLRDLCNLGHAGSACARMPSQRQADSLRFAIAHGAGQKVFLDYVCDREHAPAAYGRLEYDCANRRWTVALDDACAQRQAECYLQVYFERSKGTQKNRVIG